MSRSSDFGGDNRQTDRQADYFTLAHACGILIISGLSQAIQLDFLVKIKQSRAGLKQTMPQTSLIKFYPGNGCQYSAPV